jgi:hypothetical protein
MRASDSQSTAGLPLLSLALGGAVLAACCWSLARGPSDDAAKRLALTDGPIEAGLATADVDQAEAAARFRREAQPASGPLLVAEPEVARPAARQRPPRTERELREHFLALEARESGALVRGAGDWLTAKHTTAEKVAWLQALEQCEPRAATAWLEFACALDDAPTAQGEPVSAFALGRLAALARTAPEARLALGRVALGRDSVDDGLRRRAASTFAAAARGDEFAEFERGLLQERDELLLAGVVVSLEGRPPGTEDAAADRLLAWLRPGSAAFLARDARGER